MQSSSRNGATVRAAAVHTAEGAMRVGDLRAYFDRVGTASSHAAADETGALADGAAGGFVDYARAAWTIRNGNPWTDNLELCAFARYTRAEWLARPKLLEACALWLARRAIARRLPLEKLTPDRLRAGHRGVIDHDDYTDATGDGTHWDVGEQFPWDVVIPRARQLAGNTPAAPTRRRRRRRMFIVREQARGTVYLATEKGLTHLRTQEEVNCVGWLLDDARAANATLNHNKRFVDVIHAVLTRAPVTTPFAADAARLVGLPELPAPEPLTTGDTEAIAPPPGFDVFVSDAPEHD